MASPVAAVGMAHIRSISNAEGIEGLHSLVALQVEGQMIGARETAIAVAALEGLGTRVLPVMPRELVGTGETPLAAIPGTLVWLLACVRPLVRLEMRRLRIYFLAAVKLASMDASFTAVSIKAATPGIMAGLRFAARYGGQEQRSRASLPRRSPRRCPRPTLGRFGR